MFKGFDSQTVRILHKSSYYISDPKTFILEELVEICTPFKCPLSKIQCEFIDFQADIYTTNSKCFLEFWKKFRYPKMRNLATKLLYVLIYV